MDSRINDKSDRARASPQGDAQLQHPATVGNGQGLLHQGRVQRKKRVREVKMRIGSWNVGTMTGRGRELADILKRRRVNVACLQETKWKGTKAREIGEGYKFYYCGSDGKRNGVGIVLDEDLKQCVTDINRVNDRLIMVKIITGDLILNIISAYAPQTGCSDSEKDKFWQDFDGLMIGIPEEEEVFVGGDFNGHVGKINTDYERVHGGWGFGSRNKEGEALLEAAIAFDLAITNTYFRKRDQHLITYKSGNHTTQIDYILTKRNRIAAVKNCKVLPGEELIPQHKLLLLEIKLNSQINRTKTKTVPKIKWHLLDNREYAEKFREKVVNKMISMEDLAQKSVNECWIEMANCIRMVAIEVFGESKGKRKIDRDTWWWSSEVQQVIKDKKKAYKEWQKSVKNNDTQTKIENYKKIYNESKKNAKKAVAIAKAIEQDKLYQTLETPQGQAKLYKIIKAREKSGENISQVKCIKSESGHVLTKDEQIRERWKGYFERLMNEENDWDKEVSFASPNIGLVREINITEVRNAVQSMKNGKAVGPDGIPVEIWKFLKMDGWMWLTLFFNKLLQDEAIPDEWCTSSLVPIYKKKGDVQDCNNYRGIKLMSHTMKVWEKVLERRLREESEITQNQFGFMPGRSTTDAIFALRQLCEKYRRAHKNLHMVFVDLEKAYDRVPRKVLWWTLNEKKIPVKYIHLIQAMYSRASTYVRSAAGETGKFGVAVGLHQGSTLSPYLFLLVMDALTSDIQERAPWCMLFADDIVLVGEDGLEVQNRLGKWLEKLEKVGLNISRTKTEHLFCDFGGPSNFTPIALNGVPLPVCSDFRYLGSIIQKDGDIDRDVKSRINAGWMKWRQVTATTCDPRMPLKLKGQIYKTVIRPVVMYGSECWAAKGSDERRLHVAEMRMLRWMCGVTRMDRIRNEYIRGSLKVAPITEKISSNRLSWYGHIMRREEDHILKRAINMRVNGNCGRGRPKKVWMNCVNEDMREKGVSPDMTNDRDEWRKRTYCTDPT